MERKLKTNSEMFQNIYSREAQVLNVDEEKRSAELVVATELPVIVFDWMKWEPIREIVLVEGLRHADSVIMLDTHSRWSTNDIKGSIKNFEIKKNFEKLGTVKVGDAFFSKTAEKEWTLRQEGHLTDSSIGYRVNEKETIIIQPGQTQRVNGKEYRNDYGDNLPLYIRTGADLLEVSLVPIGADQAAKFRSAYQENFNEHNNKPNKKDTTMEKTPEQLAEEKRQADEKAAIKLNEEKRVAEETRKDQITALGKEYKDTVKGVNLEDHAKLYIRTGKSAEEFGDFIVGQIEKAGQTSVAQGHVDVDAKNIKDYDIARAFRSAKDGSKCFERDISEQASKQLGVTSNGIVIPENVLALKKMSLMSARELKQLGLTLRDLTVGGAATGAELVGLTHLVSEFIGVLYNRTLAFQLGVRRLPGQVGSLSIPKMISGSNYGFAATETGNFSESTPGTGELNLSPHRGGTYVDVSTQALVQMQPSIASLVMDDLMMAVELGIDLAYFHGTGASGQPTGLALTSGIGSFGGPSITWEGVVDAETDIETANADIGTMAYATTPAVKAVFKTRLKSSVGTTGFIADSDNSVNGYPLGISNQITAGYCFFGVFSQSVIPMWGATEVVVDEKSLRVGGLVRFLVENFIDVGVRRAGCYTLSTGTN